MIYLDNAATTPVHPQVIDRMVDVMQNYYANPSSTHQMGQVARRLLNQERQQLAEIFQVPPHEVYFTSGATEANNWALQSLSKNSSGKHWVTTAIEHPANLEVLHQLRVQGYEITEISPQIDGTFAVDQFVNASKDTTIGWVAMAVNNETGAILPIQALGKKAQAMGLFFHVDAVQGFGKIEENWADLDFTTLSLSAHKFHGPKGVGTLIYRSSRKDQALSPLLLGGGQERGYRSGTENVSGIVGFGEAIRRISPEKIVQGQALSDYLYQLLNGADIDYQINGDPTQKSAFIHHLWIRGLPSEMLLIQLDLAGIAVSAGSACSSGSLLPSRVLTSYYPGEDQRLRESIRVSFGYQTSPSDIEKFVQTLTEIIERMI